MPKWFSLAAARNHPASAQSATHSVNSLRGKTRMSVSVYGVNYPANISTGSGANDMSAHVQSMARSCPNTRDSARRLLAGCRGG